MKRLPLILLMCVLLSAPAAAQEYRFGISLNYNQLFAPSGSSGALILPFQLHGDFPLLPTLALRVNLLPYIVVNEVTADLKFAPLEGNAISPYVLGGVGVFAVFLPFVDAQSGSSFIAPLLELGLGVDFAWNNLYTVFVEARGQAIFESSSPGYWLMISVGVAWWRV
jgi:hypothetical protein